jgi:DNA-3-methyladenine glycosylase
LAITGSHDGLALDAPPFLLAERIARPEISTGPRIGITQATELSWRYLETGSPFLNRPALSRARRSA